MNPYIRGLSATGWVRRYVMEDVHRVGGTPGVMKYLLELGWLDGSCRTVTGMTVKENLQSCPPLSDGQRVILPAEAPIKKTGHLQARRSQARRARRRMGC